MKTQKQVVTFTLEWADAEESAKLFYSPESAVNRVWEKDGWRLPTVSELTRALKDRVPGFQPGDYLSSNEGGSNGGFATNGDVAVDMRDGTICCRDSHLQWDPALVRFIRPVEE